MLPLLDVIIPEEVQDTVASVVNDVPTAAEETGTNSIAFIVCCIMAVVAIILIFIFAKRRNSRK